MRKIVLAIWLLNAAFAQDSLSLVGRWRSAETSKGGIGAMYDFSADGTVRFSPGAIVPMQYKLEGVRLTTYPMDGPPFTLSWSDDDHLRLAGNGGGENYVRLGARREAGSRLVGEWTGTRNMNGNPVMVHWIFQPDSTALLMIRFLTEQGRYELQNGRLSATFGVRGSLHGAVRLADGVLFIDRGPGKTTQLKRY